MKLKKFTTLYSHSTVYITKWILVWWARMNKVKKSIIIRYLLLYDDNVCELWITKTSSKPLCNLINYSQNLFKILIGYYTLWLLLFQNQQLPQGNLVDVKMMKTDVGFLLSTMVLPGFCYMTIHESCSVPNFGTKDGPEERWACVCKNHPSILLNCWLCCSWPRLKMVPTMF